MPEPVAALRRLATLVRPGGVIAFCDFDMTAARSVPWLPTWQTAAEAIADQLHDLLEELIHGFASFRDATASELGPRRLFQHIDSSGRWRYSQRPLPNARDQSKR
jgi:hypothetical protein